LDGAVELIDQTFLPNELKILACRDLETLWEAIRNLRVRGAPAIGIAAAMGVVLGVRDAEDHATFFENLSKVCDRLAASRPTAVNLFWALDRMRRHADVLRHQPVEEIKRSLLAEAQAIRDEDAAICRAIGEVGAPLIRDGMRVLTHCNAGGLATAELGTALAVLYVAHEQGRRFQVFADETRPLLQGARLTAWELDQAGFDVTVICDHAAAHLMKAGQVDLVITGADRIAANGDTANKIGTYGLAVLARAHKVPFYVAAPRSTFDLTISDGSDIPIEIRSEDEIRKGFGRVTVPARAMCYNPAFDVTPAALICGIVTESGMIEPVAPSRIREVFQIETCKA
jgi:methylthioribose-1-phosphate isomerase